MPFAATWRNLEIITLSEVKLNKDKYQVMSLICGILKNPTNELIYKTETDSQTQKTTLWLLEGKGSRDKLGTMGLIDTHYHAKKQIKNKDLLHSKGNYVQYLVMNNYNEKE